MIINKRRKVVAMVLFTVVILTMLFNFYASTRGNTLFNTKIYSVTKGMELGNYKHGDLVLFSKKGMVSEENDITFAIGDIIGITDGKNKVSKLGEIKNITNNEIIAKTATEELSVDRNAIVGKATAYIPKLGYIIMFLKHPIFVGLVVLLFALEIIKNILKSLKAHHEYEEENLLHMKKVRKSDAKIEGLDLKALYKHHPNLHNKNNIRLIRRPKYKVTIKDAKNYKIGEDFISK